MHPISWPKTCCEFTDDRGVLEVRRFDEACPQQPTRSSYLEDDAVGVCQRRALLPNEVAKSMKHVVLSPQAFTSRSLLD